jgi:hypothetical protein
MSRFQKIIFFGLLCMVAALVYLEATKPQPINWFPSYSTTAKIPLGTLVLKDLLDDSLEEIKTLDEPPFEILQDSALRGTYLFINDRLLFDKTEFDQLYKWVENGNTVFVSAKHHSPKLLDTLSLDIRNAWLRNNLNTQAMVQLVNPGLNKDRVYHIDRNFTIPYFKEIDTLSQTVLGVVEPYNDTLALLDPKVNFIKASVGKGSIFVHTQPEIFSNYFILKEDFATHTQDVLGYINNGSVIYWDDYYKTGKKVNISPLRNILNNKNLKWAYYFLLIGVVLYVFFEGKRKQRSIPIVKPLTNKTYEYTQTISGMYLDQKQYHEIAQKQITLFYEFIRTRLRIPTEKINDRFLENVAARSGNTSEDTKTLFTFIEKVQHQRSTSKEELIKLNNEITQYKNKIDGKS